jgi:hypothetical protein
VGFTSLMYHEGCNSTTKGYHDAWGSMWVLRSLRIFWHPSWPELSCDGGVSALRGSKVRGCHGHDRGRASTPWVNSECGEQPLGAAHDKVLWQDTRPWNPSLELERRECEPLVTLSNKAHSSVAFCRGDGALCGWIQAYCSMKRSFRDGVHDVVLHEPREQHRSAL